MCTDIDLDQKRGWIHNRAHNGRTSRRRRERKGSGVQMDHLMSMGEMKASSVEGLDEMARREVGLVGDADICGGADESMSIRRR